MRKFLAIFYFVVASLTMKSPVLQTVWAQDLIIRGSIFCMPQNRSDLRRPVSKECIIVYPYGAERYATMTTDDGTFHLVVPLKDFIDKFILLICYSDTIVGTTKLFTALDMVRSMAGGKRILELSEAPIILSQRCEILGVDPIRAFDYLQKFKDEKIKSTPLDTTSLRQKLSKPTWWSFIPTALLPGWAYFLAKNETSADSTATTALNILSIQYPKIKIGNIPSFLFNQRIGGESSFAPMRTFEQVAFWNASAIAFSDFFRMSFLSDFNSFGQAFLSLPIKRQFGIGFGFSSFKQNQHTIALLESGDILKEAIPSRTQLWVFSLAYKLGESAAIGFSFKNFDQNILLPTGAIETQFYKLDRPTKKMFLTNRDIDFRSEEKNSTHFDYDLSATFVPVPFCRIGLSLINLAGTKSFMEDGNTKNIRTLGIGAAFIRRRVALGFDTIIPQQDKADFSLGLNYKLANQVEFISRATKRAKGIKVGLTCEYWKIQTQWAFNYDSIRKSSFLLGFNLKL